jgi:hypothetical protein
MTLPSQVLQYPFRLGLGEGTDPKQAPPGTLTRAVNVVWNKTGLLEKRAGTVVRGAPLNTGVGKRLIVRGTDLCATDGLTFQTYMGLTAAWRAISAIPEVGLTSRPHIDPAAGIRTSDTAVLGNLVVTAYTTGDPTDVTSVGVAPTVMITDLESGSFRMAPTVLGAAATAQGVRVILTGTTAIIVYAGDDANIYASTVSLSSFTVTATATVLRNDRVNTNAQNWDAKLVDGSTNFILAYASGAVNINLYSFTSALAAINNSVQAVAANITRISVDATLGEKAYVAYYQTSTTAVRMYIADATTLVVSVVPFTVEDLSVASPVSTPAFNIGVCRYNATNAIVIYTSQPTLLGIVSTAMTSRLVTSAGALVAATRRDTYGVQLVSAPFVLNGRCYAFGAIYPRNTTLATPFTGSNATLFAVYPGNDDGTVPVPNTVHPMVACADILLGAKSGEQGPLPRVSASTTTRSVAGIPFLGTVPNTQLVWRCGLRLLNITAGSSVPTDLWRPVNVASNAIVSGGILSDYDGLDMVDYGFPVAPVFGVVVPTGGPGFVQAGTYLYATHGEYRSAGLLHRSPTVVTQTAVTAAANDAVSIGVVGMGATNKKHVDLVSERTTSKLPIYRTIANGTVLQRLTEDPTANVLNLTYLFPTYATSDVRNDTDIDGNLVTLASRPALYTSGGVLDDYAAPASVTMFLHKSRLWILDSDEKTWWFSKSFQDDIGTAPGFHPNFRISFEDKQIAGASMDDKAVFFSYDSITVLQGEGPAPNGQNSDYGTPSKIQCDTGCHRPKSVVSTPDGIMFQGTADGIYILTRQLSVEWIGRPVQDQTTAYPVITSAVVVPAKNEVRFSCNNAGGTSGIVLVYNYQEKQWTTFVYSDTFNTSTPIADALMWNDTYTFICPNGTVYSEDASTCLDAGVRWVTADVETAEIYAQGPLSAQRVRRIYLKGDLVTACDVELRVAVGGSQTYDQDKLWKSQQMALVGTSKIGVHVRRQRCDSVRFRITDATPTGPSATIGTGAGINLSAIGFEVAPMQGMDRRGAKATK